MTGPADALTLDVLAGEPYAALAELRAAAPVCSVPAIDGWLVTSHALAIEVTRDAATFTVDDPRFSTTRVLGPSMLSLDGPEHERRRSAMTPTFRRAGSEALDASVAAEARRLVGAVAADGTAELRTALAGPLAVDTVVQVLGFDVARDEVRDWYDTFTDAIVGVTTGGEVTPEAVAALAEIRRRVDSDEHASDTAVVMFGAIETTEGMIANLLWHLLSDPDVLDEVRSDRTLVPDAVEESLRVEPAAAVVDRYATRDVVLGGATIARGDLVRVSLLAANRDPAVFDEPDRFDIHRPGARRHLAFVQGPHHCIGANLARVEAVAALDAVLDLLGGITLDPEHSEAPSGLVFRKPVVAARWPPVDQLP